MKITAVLVVDEIERSLPFWVDRMGFKKTAEAPDGDRLAFVMLENGGAELMLQTIKSVREDEPGFANESAGRVTSLFIEVDDFAETLRRLEGYEITMPDRTTFYGMREIGVHEPSGNIVVFATRVNQ